MAFFADRPDPEPEPDEQRRQRYVDLPWQAPQNWLPGRSSLSVTLARTEHTVVHLSVGDVYPRGLTFDVIALLDPEGPDVEALHRHHHHHHADPGELRLGLLWPDGRRVETMSSWTGETFDDAEFHLHPQGSQGGGIVWRWSHWLWPLPPAGAVEVFLRWDARDIIETSTPVDLTAAVEAAASAEELWPLPAWSESDGFGWISHSPMGGSSLEITMDDPPSGDASSGDAADPGDEDG